VRLSLADAGPVIEVPAPAGDHASDHSVVEFTNGFPDSRPAAALRAVLHDAIVFPGGFDQPHGLLSVMNEASLHNRA